MGAKVAERALEVLWKCTLIAGNVQELVSANLATLSPRHSSGQQSLQNLLASYELWFGNLFRTEDIRFKVGGLSMTMAEPWDMQLKRYRADLYARMSCSSAGTKAQDVTQ